MMVLDIGDIDIDGSGNLQMHASYDTERKESKIVKIIVVDDGNAYKGKGLEN